ncbi:hypothetical protein PHACT_12735 [Pseudohongiella acticola]|uniref:Uncharacterized protein n=1 Tax=Pseudohongiella acticola TaxID=1524254 RepID=A0A1E8CGA4_9GAMM|nr:hypothetical protein [Pseudohongiella acticola]OFE11416.1 hypothetical protein PHACT_12735 [Pseudohongiella acticola]
MNQTALDFTSGQSRRDAGMNAALDNADFDSKGWSDKALGFVRSFPSAQFQTEDVRQYATNHGLPVPPSARAWGAVITRAARLGIIRRVGYRPVSNANAHCTPAAVWERV